MRKLCRKARPIKNLKEGKVYTVDYVHSCSCGIDLYGLVEVKNFDIDKDPKLKTMCKCGKRIHYPYPLFGAFRFEDISELTIEYFLEEKTEVVNKLPIHDL